MALGIGVPYILDMRALLLSLFMTPVQATAECVVLLHGLARTEASMTVMQEALELHGYTIVNQGYPSRDAPIRDLIAHVGLAVAECPADAVVHFVTHSMGGILTRAWLTQERPRSWGALSCWPRPITGQKSLTTFRISTLLAGSTALPGWN